MNASLSHTATTSAANCGSVVRLLELSLLRIERGLQVTNLLPMGGQPLLLRRVLVTAAVLANV